MKLFNKNLSIDGFFRESYPVSKFWGVVYGMYILLFFKYKNWLVEDDWKLANYIVGDNHTVIDIGANVGEFSYYLLNLNLKKISIIAFEPQKSAYSVLSFVSFFRNSISTINCGASNKSSTSTIYIPINPNNSISIKESSLDQDFIRMKLKSRKKYITDTIKVDSLDKILKGYNLINLSLIKCDTEGHELEVLQGAKNTIAKYKPAILLEIFPTRNRPKVKKLITLLRRMKYSPFILSKNHLPETISIKMLISGTSTNYLFIHQSKLSNSFNLNNKIRK